MNIMSFYILGFRRAGQLLQQNCFRKCHTTLTEPVTEYIKINDSNGISRRIAYQKVAGPRKEGIVYIPGFLDHKAGIKANKLHDFSRQHGFSYVRYDPTGSGESKDISSEGATFYHWLQDAEEVLMRLTDGKQIIVGSSLGGWIASLLALKYPKKFSKILFIAPVMNYSDNLLNHKYAHLVSPEQLLKYQQGETIWINVEHIATFPVSLSLIESFRSNYVDFNKLNIDCPVRIFQGMKDYEVPYKDSLKLLKCLSGKDVMLQYFKDGDHTLTSEKYLRKLCEEILCDI